MTKAEKLLKVYCKEKSVKLLDLFTRKELVQNVPEKLFMWAVEDEYAQNPNLLPCEVITNVENWLFYKNKQEIWEECLPMSTRKVLLEKKAKELKLMEV